jgi:hypothetical protein
VSAADPIRIEVAEGKYFVPFNRLKHEDADWKRFFVECDLA